MDRERLDSLIDRGLRRELSVTPPAGFHARLDEQLALERERRVWPPWLTIGLALGAVAAILLGAVLLRSPTRQIPTVAVVPQVDVPSVARVDVSAGSPPPTVTEVAPRVPADGSGRAPQSQLRDVEVIVPRGQAAAIQRFAETLRDDMGNRGWIPVLALAAPNSDSFAFPSVPTIDRLPTVPNFDPERK